MSRYLLDTNILSEIIRNGKRSVADVRIEQVGEDNVCTSIIVAAEIRYGLAQCSSPRLDRAARKVLSLFPILPLESPVEEIYGRVRAGLEGTGTPIGSNDLLIAAHCLALDATLVTDNLREFARVPGLRIENWLTRMTESPP